MGIEPKYLNVVFDTDKTYHIEEMNMKSYGRNMAFGTLSNIEWVVASQLVILPIVMTITLNYQMKICSKF